MNYSNRFTAEAIVHIYESELHIITDYVQQQPNLETGGDLFGTFTHGDMPAVWYVTGPGRDAHGQSAEFRQDTNSTTQWQRFLMENFGLQYIGTWHSHHNLGLNKPSIGDIRAVQSYARRHERSRSLEIIVNFELGKIVHRPYYYVNAPSGEYVLANFRMLRGECPIRPKVEALEPAYNFGKRGSKEYTQSNMQGETRTLENNTGLKENLNLPSSILDELKNLDVEGVSIEAKTESIYLIVVPLSFNHRIAIAIDVRKKVSILQANYINPKKNTNEDITDLLQKNNIISRKHQRQKKLIRSIYEFSAHLDI